MELFPALIFGNLFSLLLWEQMDKEKKNERRTEKRFANTLWFIDDLIVLSDVGEFERSLKEIFLLEFKE